MNDRPEDRILSLLEGVRKSRDGWDALCPAHDDHTPSLSIGIGEEGRVLVHCHGGCSTAEICLALGIKPSDLFPPQANGNGKVRATVETTYDYRDEAGELLFQVVRMLPKSFRQRRPDGNGCCIWNLSDTRRVLYRLPELLAADPSQWVLIPEGEKDVNRLAELGFCATTTSGGASAWRKTDLNPLHGRKVVLLADHDEPGRKRVWEMAKALCGKATEVRIVAFPELPPGGDVSDWIATCTNPETDICGLLVERIEKAQPYKPVGESPGGPENAVAKPNIHASSKGIEWKPFPVEVLPKHVDDYVRVVTHSIGCDESFAVLPLLSMLASAIGSTRQMEIKEGWCEPCIIWTTIIGESGTKKSPPLEKAIAPLMRRQRDAIYDYRVRRSVYEKDKEKYDKSILQWKRSSKSDGEPPTPPEPPECVRYVVDDCTIEAIVSVLQSNPRGVLLGPDELSQWLRSFSEYKSGRGGDTPKWLKIFNGRNLVVDRKTNVRLTVVPCPHVSISGGIQPWVLRKELGTEHFADGLASRLLLAFPPPRRSPWTEVGIPDHVRDGLDAIVGTLLTLEPGIDENGRRFPISLSMTPSAQKAWIKFYNEIRAELSLATGSVASALSKIEGYASRLALVVQLTRWACGEASRDQVDEESMRSGIRMALWFAREAERIYGLLGAVGEELSGHCGLIGWVREHGGSTTVRDLVRGNRKYRGESDMAENDLERLVRTGLLARIDVAPSVKGGKPTVRYKAVEGVDVDDTSADDPENRGIGTVDSVDTVGTYNTPRAEPVPESCENKQVHDSAESGEWPDFVSADESPIPVSAEVAGAGGNR